MKKLVLFSLSILLSLQTVFSQTSDTTVFEAPELPAYPLLNLCQAERHSGWTVDSVRNCGELNLMRLISQNIQYPEAARAGNIQGTVVLRLKIEKEGRASQIEVIKDIGGGCGPEVLRVVRSLDSLGLRWAPATNAGLAVRSYKILPFKFKLAEALPYVLTAAGDTVYTSMDRQPEFQGGLEALYSYLLANTTYPKAYADSCKAGVIECSLLVRPNGKVSIQEQLDFNNLGFDFQFSAIQLLNRTEGKWQPATYKDKAVPTTTTVRVLFKSDKAGCKTSNEQFDKAMLLADEAAILNESGDTAGAIKKFSEALVLDPKNTELLYYRGTLYFNSEQKEAACQDYNQIKTLLGYTWFEQVRRLLCGW